jgi:hypothetical protein
MQNSKTNSANSASQPALPFSTAPLDFSQPVECRFHQLVALRDKAAAAGFCIIRLKVIPGGYEAQFQRKPADAITAMLETTRRTFAPDVQTTASAKPDGKASDLTNI